MNIFAGFEYDTCCWRARLVAQQFITDATADPRNTIYLQLELKGLASVGHEVDEFLEKNILGYRAD